MEITGALSAQSGLLAALPATNQDSDVDKDEATKQARNQLETQQVLLNLADTKNRPIPGAAAGSIINTNA